MTKNNIEILFEDNHLIIVNKLSSDLVQADKTGDITLADKVKEYIKNKYNKSGEVFLGITHRIDRPTSGIVLFAKTSKALSRINDMFKNKQIKKIYWAIVEHMPDKHENRLVDYIKKNEQNNKSYISSAKDAKEAILNYKLISKSDIYFLVEINLETGRHHQIRVQLSNIGSVIKGDVKYGARRANVDKSISLHSRKISFIHPVSLNLIEISAPVPNDNLWKYFEKLKN